MRPLRAWEYEMKVDLVPGSRMVIVRLTDNDLRVLMTHQVSIMCEETEEGVKVVCSPDLDNLEES